MIVNLGTYKVLITVVKILYKNYEPQIRKLHKIYGEFHMITHFKSLLKETLKIKYERLETIRNGHIRNFVDHQIVIAQEK